MLGAHLSYEHWWSDNLRSTLAGGYSQIDFPDRIHPGVSFAGLQESTASAHLNLMWLPVSLPIHPVRRPGSRRSSHTRGFRPGSRGRDRSR